MPIFDDFGSTGSAGELVAGDDAGTILPEQAPVWSDFDIPLGEETSGVGGAYNPNEDVVTTTESQSVNDNTDSAPPKWNDDTISPGGGPGASDQGDDYGNRQNTATIVNSLFNSRIVPQPNVLGEYASYTYSVSWYLMEPNIYKSFLQNNRKSLQGFQLIMQSGGAPATVASASPSADAGEFPGLDAFGADIGEGLYGTTNATIQPGRSPFFQYDYYIDNLEITSWICGAGTRLANNAMDIRFTVTEPNGITLINNLYQAVSSTYKKSDIPYGVAQYCLAIRFYGYDQNGKLMQVGKRQNSTTDSRAVIEKFYPFIISNIRFKLSNKFVEYSIDAKPIPYMIGFGQNLGVVKAPFELSGTTVKDVLAGKNTNGTAGQTKQPPLDGREDSPVPPTNDTESIKVGDLTTQEQAAIAAGTSDVLVTEDGMAFGGGGL